MKKPESAEVTALLIQFLWERPLHADNSRQKAIPRAHSPPAKAATKKSSVLQTIYGECKHEYKMQKRNCYSLNVQGHRKLM